MLPQFAGGTLASMVGYALTLVAVGSIVLLGVTLAAWKAGRLLHRVRVRRSIEAGTGTVMLAFAGTLAANG